MLDPDEQAQSVIRLVFELFETRGTIHGVLRYLVDNGVRLPFRVASGANKGELDWRRPNRVSLCNLLHNPIYAGAYVYGRRPTDPRRKSFRIGHPQVIPIRARSFRGCARTRHRVAGATGSRWRGPAQVPAIPGPRPRGRRHAR